MHYWNDNYDAWWWMIPMMVFMLAIIGVILWALVHAARNDQPTSPSAPSPEEVLAQRFAAGEIDGDEYRERRDALREVVASGVSPSGR